MTAIIFHWKGLNTQVLLLCIVLIVLVLPSRTTKMVAAHSLTDTRHIPVQENCQFGILFAKTTMKINLKASLTRTRVARSDVCLNMNHTAGSLLVT